MKSAALVQEYRTSDQLLAVVTDRGTVTVQNVDRNTVEVVTVEFGLGMRRRRVSKRGLELFPLIAAVAGVRAHP